MFVSVCEPAGPGFDGSPNLGDPKVAFKQSQCIHTNMTGFGTGNLVCDQDWRMGDCGIEQIAERYIYFYL